MAPTVAEVLVQRRENLRLDGFSGEVLGLGDVAGEPPSGVLRAGPTAAIAIATERMTPCGSSASSWWATSCRRDHAAASLAEIEAATLRLVTLRTSRNLSLTHA